MVLIKKRLLRKLRSDLPRGSASAIRDRLMAKGEIFTSDYINKVLDPMNTRYNISIINEAINLRDDIKSIKKKIEKRLTTSSN
jgi:hypothetical protein